MRKLVINIFYVIIGLSTAAVAYILFTGKDDIGFNPLLLLIAFIAISVVSLLFLRNKKDDTLF